MSLLNRLKVVPMGSMRMLRVLSRSSAGEALHFLGDGGELGVIQERGGLAEPCLHRHQFSHEVDEHVELVGGYPDARYSFILCL